MNKSSLLNLLLSGFFLFSNMAFSQVTWEKLFSKKSTVSFRNVLEVPSGGYLVVGYTADSTINDTDAYVVRMTTAGDTLWTRKINGPNNGKDLFYRAINTGDGGFAFCGYSTNNGIGNDDAFILKMNSAGTVQWSKYWGGSGKERAQDIVQTADGGFAIGGYTTSAPAAYYDAFIVRFNSSGDTLWSKRYGTGGFDDANTIVLLPDQGFLLGGQSTNGSSGLDMYLVRVRSNGDTLWTKKFGTSGTDNIEHIIRQSDGSFILAGGTDGPGLGGNDGYAVKTDSGGTVLWSKFYGGNSQDDFHQVYKTLDGGFIFSGTSRSSGAAGPNMWMMKTNSSGDSTWSRTYGGDNHDHGYSAVQTTDGGYILCGYSSSFGFNAEEAYLVKTNGSGNISDYLTYITVAALTQPLNGSCVNNNVQLKVVVRNFGRDTVPNVPVSIQITGPITQTLNQTYSGSVPPGELDTLTFSTAVNLSVPGLYTFSCTSLNVNDVFPANNSLINTLSIIDYSMPPTSTTDGFRCGTGSVALSASSGDSVFWYNASTGGSLVGIGASLNTPLISTTTTYYAQAGFNCPSSRVPVVANILSTPTAPVTVSDQRCGTGTVTLSASASDPVRWFNSSTGGTQLGNGNTFTTPSISATTVYYAEAFNAGCGSIRTSATATINPVSANPVVTHSSRCDSGPITLNATAADPIFWFDAAVGGNLVGTGNSYTTPSLTVTTTYYAEASAGNCPSNRIAAIAGITSQVPDPVVSPGSRCGSGTVSLSASSNDILIWYANSSGGSQLGSGSTFVTPFITTTTTYYVIATNGACPSNYVPVQAVIHPNFSVSLGPDTALVSGSTYILDPGAGFSSYSWTGGDSSQTLSVNNSGTYCVTVSNANGCTSSDCVNIQFSIGIENPEIKSGFSIYPNPFNEMISLLFEEEISKARYQLFSVDGRLILEKDLENISSKTAVPINTSELSGGIYFLNVSTKDWSISRRILRR